MILLYKNAKTQITRHRPNNFYSKDINNYPFLAYNFNTYIILTEIITTITTEQVNLFNYLENMIFYEKELKINNKLHNYLKITGILK